MPSQWCPGLGNRVGGGLGRLKAKAASTSGKPLSCCDVPLDPVVARALLWRPGGCGTRASPWSPGGGGWACAPAGSGALRVADRSRNAAFLGSLFPLLTTIGPRNRNHQWSIHWKASCLSGARRSSLPLPHIPPPSWAPGPRAAQPSGLEALNLSPSGTGMWSRVQAGPPCGTRALWGC